MKNIVKNKHAILFTAILALVSLVALGSALKDFSFLPAQQLSHSDSATIKISVDNLLGSIVEVPFWKQVVFWVLLSILVLLFSLLLSPEMRKRLLIFFLRTMFFVVFLYYIFEHNPGILEKLFLFGNSGTDLAAPSLLEDVPPPVFVPPQISGWLSFFITFGIVLFSTLVIWRVNLWWKQQNEVPALPRPLDEIARIARTSLHELSLGNVSLHDTIIQCYARMSRVVDVKRGLYRDSAMTPAEFAVCLEKAGLPRGPVNRLTHLFESVRYGTRTTEQHDVDEAISCLTSILEYCGETV